LAELQTPPASRRPQLRPWYFVICFGLVSLFADMVYEGARSIIGPYLATLGASAAVVGAVAGIGEFIGYGLRVASGYLVQRRGRYWTWTITGYALTVLSVPLIGVTTVIAPALLLYGTERLGKAVRSPAKDTLLSYASTQTGRGTAFGVHQAMDQAGAVAGPLILAAVLWQYTGDYRLAFGVLIVPGVIVMGLLFWLRHRVPDPLVYEVASEAPEAEVSNAGEVGVSVSPGAGHPAARPPAPRTTVQGPDRGSLRPALSPVVWEYIGTVGLLSLGIASFPLLAFHAQTQDLLTPAQIPLVFALAMAVDGLSGLAMGRFYDRRGPGVLLLVPSPSLATRPWCGSEWRSGESSTASSTRPSRPWSPDSSSRPDARSRSAGWPLPGALACCWRVWSWGWSTTGASPWSSGSSWGSTPWR
jgi:MFS family permease